MIALITQGLDTARRSLAAVGLAVIVAASWDLGATLLFSRHPLPPELVREWRQEIQALAERYSGGPSEGSTAPERAAPPFAEEAQQLRGRLAVLGRWLVDARWLAAPLALLALFGWAWVTAGRLGYLDAQLNHPSPLWTFCVMGTRRLASAIAVAGLRLGFGAAAVAISVALIILEQVGSMVWRTAWSVVADVGFFSLMALTAWFSVVSVFWFIAAVVDQLGPVAALRASIAAVRGQFWSVCGLLVGWILVGLAVMVLMAYPRGLLDVAVGPQAARIFDASVGAFIVVFARFAFDASLIACYRHGQALASHAGQPGGADA